MPSGTRNGEEPVTEKKLWVPTSPLEPNVQRMAWLLFLECWKIYLAHPEEYQTCGVKGWKPEDVYATCLKNAKVVRRLEQPEKHGVPAN